MEANFRVRVLIENRLVTVISMRDLMRDLVCPMKNLLKPMEPMEPIRMSFLFFPAAAGQLMRPRCVINAITIINIIRCGRAFKPVNARNPWSDAAACETITIADPSCVG